MLHKDRLSITLNLNVLCHSHSVLCFSCDHFNQFCSNKGKIDTTYNILLLKRQNRHYLFDMSYLEVFGVLTGVRVEVSKFC